MLFSGARKWVYAQEIKGRFERIHRYLGFAQLLILFVVPFIPVGGHPAVHIDLAARRMYLLGATYTPADTMFLLIVLLMAAFGLFFFTSLYGRLWCGYACPQTVFIEQIIRPIERLLEGSRTQQMRRDAQPGWTLDRVWRKSAKLIAFAGVSWVLGASMMAYFAGPEIWWGAANSTEYALAGTFAFFLYWDFAWFREQFCNYVCPYARFQSVLCDDESLVVAYDDSRGEPRGKVAAARGGCVDCNKCVQVCPAGIDIREGYQLECITCGRCIDACETVMPKLGHPNLIRYATIAETQGAPVRLLRPRTAIYGGLLVALTVALVVIATGRHTLQASVNRLPGPAFTVDADGWVRNTYLLKVTNNQTAQVTDALTVTLDGLPDAELTVPELALGPTESRTVPLVVRMPPAKDDTRTLPFVVRIGSQRDTIDVQATFKTSHGKEPGT